MARPGWWWPASQTEVTQHQVVELARAGAEIIELDVDDLLARRVAGASRRAAGRRRCSERT